MCFAAQVPNAREPPALLIRATMMPSSTKKTKIPAVSLTAEIRPSEVIASIALRKSKFAYIKPPTTIPIASEE